MFEHRDLSGSQFKTYEVYADDFELYPGDRISPGCEIGIDIRTGTGIILKQWGQVATVYYNPMNHSFLVMVQVFSSEKKAGNKVTDELALMPA
jgi:hypothetical protein